MELFSLKGKVAVVTGGSRGLGWMIARGLIQAGAAVIITSRKAAAGEEAERDLRTFGDDVKALTVDLSSEAECLRLASEVAARAPAIDILVNNAGATWGAPLQEFPASAWDKVLALNLKAPFFLARAFLPMLERAATSRDPARIINVGSIDGIRVSGLPTYSYSASKAALHHLTRVLARELGPRHITVNAVAPGLFPSKMTATSLDSIGAETIAATPLGRLGEPDDMAGVAVYLSSRAACHVTGAVIPVDGGLATTR